MSFNERVVDGTGPQPMHRAISGRWKPHAGRWIGVVLLAFGLCAGILSPALAQEADRPKGKLKGLHWFGKQYWDPAPGNGLPNLLSMTGTFLAVADRVSTDRALQAPGAVESNRLFRDRPQGAKWAMSQGLNFGRNALLRQVWKDERKWVKGIAIGIWVATLGLEIRAVANNESIARRR